MPRSICPCLAAPCCGFWPGPVLLIGSPPDTTTPLKPCGTNSAHYQIAGAPIYDGVDINNRPRFTIPVKVGPLREAPGQDTKKRNAYKLKQIQALAPFSGRATLTILGSNQQVSVSGVDQWWGKSGKQFLLKLTLTEKAHAGYDARTTFSRSRGAREVARAPGKQ
eukprot:gene6776-6473_t